MSEEKKNLICAALARDLETIRNVMRQGGMNRNVDPAIRRANLDARRRQFESDLREPLGDEVFEALVYYRDTKPCRELAGSISEQMKESGCELDAEDVDKMVRLFKDNGVMLANEHIRSRAPGIAKASARMLSAKEEVIIKEAGDFLSPRQMDVLKQIWSGLTGNEGRQVANKK
ncbi:hypothetical protein AW736_15100 [Termitidicoccus mucosus]|uniref:Uncharacterized protein n=2 Tax=Termitidicoccus mucosus TaxID=1184151 RepID=A0A178IG72_9BACT|nr:hypothetical protein AW736_15100 [Opitutaceae bacterium TSB47]